MEVDDVCDLEGLDVGLLGLVFLVHELVVDDFVVVHVLFDGA